MCSIKPAAVIARIPMLSQLLRSVSMPVLAAVLEVSVFPEAAADLSLTGSADGAAGF